MDDDNFLRAGQFDNEPRFGFASGATPVANAGTPAQVGSPEEIEAANMQIAVQQANEQIAADPGRFDINVDDDITSDVLQGQATFEDVRALRSQRETTESNATTLTDFDPEVTGVAAFDDPEQTIRSLLFDTELSQAEQQQQDILQDVSRTTSGTDEALTTARERAEDTTQISERQSALAETNEKLARRQTRFRRELRSYESDAERRGVDRTFFEQGRNKLEADAIAEIADLSIIQQAQQGNVEAARNYINTAVDNRYKSIEIELRQKQSELDALIPTLQREQKLEAQQLQLALGERERNLANEKEEAKAKRELAITAAQNGASSSTINAITNAASVDAALSTATPFIGLLERQAAQRAASNAALARRKTLVDLALKGDKNAMAQLGEYGETIAAALNSDDPEEARREAAFVEATEKIDLAKRIKDNKLGLNLNTGASQSPFLTGAIAGPLGGTQQGNAFDLLGFIPGIGNAMNYSRAVGAKEDFLADIKSLVAPEALAELVRQKDAGATFGALSNQELSLLVSASQELAGHVILKDDGTVNIIGSPTAVQQDLDRVISFYEKAQFETNASEIDAAGTAQIDSL